MRIIFDHNTPAPLRKSLPDHQVETTYERGWAELTNGDLLSASEEAGFELMITTDQSIRYQQNLTGRKLAILVLSTNDWTAIRSSVGLVVAAVAAITRTGYIEIQIPEFLNDR